MTDANTGLLAVIGHPVSHSLSPAIHNAALRHDGRNAVYLAFDVPPGDLARALDGLRAIGSIGVNVTIPHKEAALAYADDASDEARAVGAANLLLLQGARVRADNTDMAGFAGALRDVGIDPSGLSCFVMGAGGGARAAVAALLRAGAESVVVANRTIERAERLARDLSPIGVVGAEPWSKRAGLAASSGLVVNATSIGLGSRDSPLDERPLADAAIGGCRGLIDLVYGSGETELVQLASRAGLVAVDGLPMLVHQAAAAYEAFLGRPAPLGVMRDAAAKAAGREPAPRPAG